MAGATAAATATAAMPSDLPWLSAPDRAAWTSDLDALRVSRSADPSSAWSILLHLAGFDLDAFDTARLDRELTRLLAANLYRPPALEPVRLAFLASSTVRHLLPSIRIAGLRRGLLVEIYEAGYGQYLQEVLEPSPALESFHPDFVLFSLDAHHLAALETAELHERLHLLWSSARDRWGATVLQQTALPVFAGHLGSNEHRDPASAAARLLALNHWLRSAAESADVHLLALDQAALHGGLDHWHDAALWNLSKQEVHPNASPLFGDLLARLLAAARGRSRKCVVLDLDDTLWHGVVGDDGPSGIQVGQGSALAEAHLAFQHVLAGLRRRGILLAVCSKNDEANARAAFLAHPHLPLQPDSFAAFVANWQDKATNLRNIAQTLNLSLDALVFVDDNPAERALIRRELPEVAVPEIGSDPSRFPQILLRAGYFEALALTSDDLRRSAQYAARSKTGLPSSKSPVDLREFLKDLDMVATLQPFQDANLTRIVQLANKTNQFNLTGLRITPQLVQTWQHDPNIFTLQVSLADRFGDHGIVALLVAELSPSAGGLRILLWVMSCRVFGRELEHLCRNHLITAAQGLGAYAVFAPLRPSARNGLLRDRLAVLGFNSTPAEPDLYTLPANADPLATSIAESPSPVPVREPLLSTRP